MRIAQHFSVPFPPPRVWAFFHDAAGVARCIPGAELGDAAGDGRLAGRIAVKLGPIAAAFAGEAEIAYDDAARRGTISGSGSDRRSGSRARGTASFALSEEPDGTRVEIAVDYTLAGALAQFNRGGIVADLAARLTAQFADNLRAALAAEGPHPAPPPVAAGGLLIAVLWERLLRWLRRRLGRA
jgi:uncharacterized protein